MGAVVDPFARCGDPLASRDHRGVPDHRNEFSVAAGLDPQNAEAILFIMVGDTFDQSGQNLAIRWRGRNLHNARHRLGCHFSEHGPPQKTC